MKILFALLFSLLVFTSCKKGFDDIVRDSYKQQEDNAVKQIDLSKALDFDWDTLYVFDIGIPPTEEIVNATLPDLSFDLCRVIFFKKNNRIIYYEYCPIEDFSDDDVLFIFEEDYLKIPRNKSQFNIKKDDMRGYMLYEKNKILKDDGQGGYMLYEKTKG